MSSTHPATGLPRREAPAWVVLLGLPFFGLSLLFALLGALGGVSVVDAVSAGRNSGQSIDLPAGGAVAIHARAANLVVLPGPDGQVSVSDAVSVRSPTQSLARQALDRFTRSRLAATSAGVSVDIPGEDFAVFAFNFHRTETVRIPAGAALTVDGTAVAADIRGLTGQLNVAVTSGAIRLRGVTVNAADSVTTTAGAIDFEGSLAGGSLDIETQSGGINVSLPAGTNASYDVATSSGAILVAPEHGRPYVSAGANNSATGIFGDGTGAALRLRATSGGISVRVR